MIVFPNCKINLGLNVVEKRPDGFHNIETVFYEVGWRDALEAVSGQNDFEIEMSGLPLASSKKEENIIFKAYDLINQKLKLPPIKVFLHKNIPMGAGLGGGSADASFFMSLLNEKFGLKIPRSELKDLAANLGSDCPFFFENKPLYATEKGDRFEPVQLNLNSYYILVVYPGIHSNTKAAYDGILPKKPKRSVKDIIEKEPIENWKNVLFNDFEEPIFKKYPLIASVKESLYNNGAVYAAMSGSGSAVYGIFNEKPHLNWPPDYRWHLNYPLKCESIKTY